ncbi:MAG: NAD(P)H-hydrate dehydratase [Pirellulales bacterium]|nr:NAD(P)H-hydrate dehydratase [Pirellulales bacterium]
MNHAGADDASLLPRLPERHSDSHKGDYGRLLVVGGSTGMAGAVALAGMAALRAGAGLVRLAVPAACQATAAGFEPALMTVGLAHDDAGRIAATARQALAAQLDWATVVACGPGLGSSPDLVTLVQWIYAEARCPVVVDADGLNALAAGAAPLDRHAAPRVLTPHPGEFARLAGQTQAPAAAERRDACQQLALRAGAVVVLKGHGTVVSDGARADIVRTGNPGMATGGTGDVLTGVIAALLAQGLPPFEA